MHYRFGYWAVQGPLFWAYLVVYLAENFGDLSHPFPRAFGAPPECAAHSCG